MFFRVEKVIIKYTDDSYKPSEIYGTGTSGGRRQDTPTKHPLATTPVYHFPRSSTVSVSVNI